MNDKERETVNAVSSPSSAGNPPDSRGDSETAAEQPAGCLTAGIAIAVAFVIVILASVVASILFGLLVLLLPREWRGNDAGYGVTAAYIGVNCGVPAGIATGYLFPGNLRKASPTYRAWYLGTLLLLTVLMAGGLSVCGGLMVVNKSWIGLAPFVAFSLFILPAMHRAGVFRKRATVR